MTSSKNLSTLYGYCRIFVEYTKTLKKKKKTFYVIKARSRIKLNFFTKTFTSVSIRIRFFFRNYKTEHKNSPKNLLHKNINMIVCYIQRILIGVLVYARRPTVLFRTNNMVTTHVKGTPFSCTSRARCIRARVSRVPERPRTHSH